LIRSLALKGHTDREIAQRLGLSATTVYLHRHAEGVPAQGGPTAVYARRARIMSRRRADPAYEQRLRRSIAERHARYRAATDAYARRSGWPAGLQARSVQVLNLLAAVGLPLTKREIGRVLGLSQVDPYLHELIEGGLLTALPNWKPGSGTGRRGYTLGPAALSLLEERAKCEASTSETPA
jgi:DNA-binding CsgD family transcriptional regulator